MPQIYFVKGQVELFRRNYEEAVRHAEHASSIKPNYADAHALLAWILHFAGRPRDGLASMDRAVHLNPRMPSIYRMVRGALNYSEGNTEMALADLVPAVAINPNFQQLRIWLAAAYAAAGRIDAAQWESEEILALYPNFPFPSWKQDSLSGIRIIWSDFLADLRLAGLP